jgi:hypothetical protein
VLQRSGYRSAAGLRCYGRSVKECGVMNDHAG